MELMRTVLLTSRNNQEKVAIFTFWILLVLLVTFLPLNSMNNVTAARQNNPPNAVISAPDNGDIFEVNEVVHFDGSESDDPDNDALSYKWDFGDGTSGSGAKPSHVYNTPWVPLITLEVTDGQLNDTARIVIVIGTGGGQNRPPNASIDSPSNFDTFSIGETIIFDGSSSDDFDDDPLTYNWDFGDDNTSEKMITTHSYSELNPYIVTLTVSDGIFNDSERIMIFVNNTPPIADAGEDQVGYLGQKLSFDGSNSSDPDRIGNIDNYTWNMGDNTEKYGARISHRFSRYGSFDVTLTVTDNNGETDSDDLKVIIKNAPPKAVLKINSEDTVVNTDLEFDASDSYDPDGDVEEYYYDFGDGTESDWIYESVVLHRYFELEEYNVTLRVKDDNLEVSDLAFIKITIYEKINQPPSVTITYPSQDESVAGSISISGSAVDPDNEIEKVEVMIDDSRWYKAEIVNVDDNSVDWEFDWDTEDYSDGSHVIFARAWDGDKYSTEQSISVNVNNRPTTYIEITEQLRPDTVSPGEKVTVSGSAKYDTNVPVVNTKVEISITETQREWATQTNDQGKYSYKISSPADPGKYTVTVYITDGTLERETSEKLMVESEPPDLSINEDEIIFSKNRPNDKEEVKIVVTISNNGGTVAFGRVFFYEDTIQSSNLFDSQEINVPEDSSISVSSNWTAKAGRHDIIVLIGEITPAESDTTNNQAIKRISVLKSESESKDKAQENILEQISNLPPLYKYGALGLLIIIIFVVFGLAYKIRSSRSGDEVEEKQKTNGRVENLPPGMVVFKPLEEKVGVGGKQTKKPIIPIIVIIFAILSLILMGISLTQPWYKITQESDVGELEQNYSFDEIKITDSASGISITASWTDDAVRDFGAQRNIYNIVKLIVIGGLILGIFLLIGAILALLKKGKKVAIIFGILAFIICLLAPLIFMLMIPGAFAEDYNVENDEEEDGPYKSFIGSSSVESFNIMYKRNWGPSTGWYLAVAGAIFALLGFIFAIAIPKPIQDTAISPRPAPFKHKQLPDGRVTADPGTFKFQVIEEDDSDIISSEKKSVRFETIGIR